MNLRKYAAGAASAIALLSASGMAQAQTHDMAPDGHQHWVPSDQRSGPNSEAMREQDYVAQRAQIFREELLQTLRDVAAVPPQARVRVFNVEDLAIRGNHGGLFSLGDIRCEATYDYGAGFADVTCTSYVNGYSHGTDRIALARAARHMGLGGSLSNLTRLNYERSIPSARVEQNFRVRLGGANWNTNPETFFRTHVDVLPSPEAPEEANNGVRTPPLPRDPGGYTWR